MNDSRKNFWTTLPGIMTGTASLITALLALVTFTMGNCRNEKAPAPPPEPQIMNLNLCPEIAGSWDWFTGGVVTISEDGGLLWRQNPALPQSLSAVGRWTCLDTTPHTFTLSWQTGLTDQVRLSPDGKSLSGKNLMNGVVISGTRRDV